ncbi:hypothetical protein ACFV2X_43710 [Streptomyces sp. NPDC059679]|uniref:hypothetical protein n=1 Tax=Streptomyces sp. NPDC059679 TaxID=3346903 RepID=UPI0036920FC4
MVYVIAWIFEALLRLVLPPSGRHRAADGRPAVQHRQAPTMRAARVPDTLARPVAAECVNASAVEFRPVSGSPDGHGAAMIRPYVVAHEQLERAERRLRRQRRRALWLAVHGIDVRPRLIHGVKVAA